MVAGIELYVDPGGVKLEIPLLEPEGVLETEAPEESRVSNRLATKSPERS